MADFVAVIRRAVDGLTVNTPETRAKVYEKARGAVQRQLENMKPRPPEDMLRRQMDKLELAIVEVEGEHAEAAVPAEADEPAWAEEAAPAAAAVTAAAVVHEAHEPEPEPHHEPEPAEYHEAEPARYAEPEEPRQAEAEAGWADERQIEDHQSEQAYHEPGHEEPAVAEPAYEEPADEEPAYRESLQPERDEDVPAVPAFLERTHHDHHDDHDDAAAGDHGQDPAPLHAHPHALAEEAITYAEPEHVAPHEINYGTVEPHIPAYEEGNVREEPAFARDLRTFEEEHRLDVPPAAYPGQPSADVAAAWDDVPELIPAGPVEPVGRPSHADHVDAHFDHETHISADAVRMPAVAELPAVHTASPEPEDLFADYAPTPAATGADGKTVERDPWSDLEDLIGYNKDAVGAAGASAAAVAAGASASQGHTDDDLEDLMRAPAKPYRVTPVRKRNYAGILLGVVGLVLVAGGAYAVWMNRDSLSGLVGGLMSSSSKSDTAQTTPAATTPAKPAGSTTAAPTPASNAASSSATATKPAAATADGSTTAPKFTQRLMQDGSEVDQGPGAQGNLAQNAEGQSVAQLTPPANPPAGTPPPATSAPATGAPAAGTPAPATPTPDAAGQTPPAATAPTPTPPQANQASPNLPTTPSASPADAPAASGEKMFLYEERLGQTAPTAIDGTVSWSLIHEPNDKGGPPEAEVQGRISVPGRGLTALLTLKRNTDPSLPASHLIELVFSVPKDFEGGAIDSVQRIAMKTTEQDRGNALIAVPAKITDDFHMIALNDFPDARKTNMDLLQNRDWMDIPVAYRNGRRALFTLQKGPDGQKAFNDAIAEWNRTPAPTGGQ